MARPTPASSSASWRPGALAWLGLLALVTLCYLPCLRGPLVFDDILSIRTNHSIESLFPPHFETTGGTNGRPLANLSFALGHALGAWEKGDRVIVQHGLSLAAFLGMILVAGAVLRRGLSHAWTSLESSPRETLAFLITALWALHPVNTETVAYLSQRTELLAGLFYLLTLLAFQRGIDEPDRKARWFTLSSLACLAGAACKEIIVTAPLLILLYDRCLLTRSFKDSLRQRWRLYAGLLLSWLLLAVLMHQMDKRGVGFDLAVGPWGYAKLEAIALCRYAKLAFWPSPLVFDYGLFHETSLASLWPQACAVLLTLGLSLYLLATHPRLGFLLFAPFLLLAPSSSIIPVAFQPIAEHRLFLALIPMLCLSAVACLRVIEWRRIPPAGLHLLWLGVLPFALLCFERSQDYASASRLWAKTASQQPDNARAWANLGASYLEENLPEKAEDSLQRALRLQPDSTEALLSLGLLRLRQGRSAEAEPLFRRCLALNNLNQVCHYNLAVLVAERNPTEAEAHYRQAIEQNPYDANPRINLALLLEKQRGPDAAAKILSEACEALPASAELAFLHARNLLINQHPAEGIRELVRTLEIDPEHREAHDILERLQQQMQKAPR